MARISRRVVIYRAIAPNNSDDRAVVNDDFIAPQNLVIRDGLVTLRLCTGGRSGVVHEVEIGCGFVKELARQIADRERQ